MSSEPAETPPDATLEGTVASLQGALVGRPRDFSPEAVGVLLERQSEYVEELGLEAIRLARRNRSDVVSAADVERGDEIVRSAAHTRTGRILETGGGVLLGGGLGQLYAQIALGDDATTVGWIVAIASAVVGLVLLTWSFARR